MVRLTNENAVREHTDEDGDLFLWFKHQASQGIVGAQVIHLSYRRRQRVSGHPRNFRSRESNNHEMLIYLVDEVRRL